MNADASVTLLIGFLFVTVLIGFVALSLADVSTGAYVLFVSGPLMTTIVGAVLTKRVGTVAAVVEKVEKQTNGLASAAIARIDDHLTAQDETAVAVAADASEQRAGYADGSK